jgi:hypothetical protein
MHHVTYRHWLLSSDFQHLRSAGTLASRISFTFSNENSVFRELFPFAEHAPEVQMMMQCCQRHN